MQWDRGLRILTNTHLEAWHSKYMVLMWVSNFGCGLHDYLIVYFLPPIHILSYFILKEQKNYGLSHTCLQHGFNVSCHDVSSLVVICECVGHSPPPQKPSDALWSFCHGKQPLIFETSTVQEKFWENDQSLKGTPPCLPFIFPSS